LVYIILAITSILPGAKVSTAQLTRHMSFVLNILSALLSMDKQNFIQSINALIKTLTVNKLQLPQFRNIV